MSRAAEYWAEWFGVSVERMESWAREMPPQQLDRALLRAQIFCLPTAANQPESRADVYRREVAHLVENKLAPSKTRAIGFVADYEGVRFSTVFDAIYRPKRRRRPKGFPK